MARLPRLAVGTLQPAADATALLWGLTAALEFSGVRVQDFLARACFSPRDGATVITGHASRHLDSWLMSPAACRDAFLRGAAGSGLSLVEGRFAAALSPAEFAGGQLELLCQWLELPSLAVVDTAQLSACQLPERPAASALLLDRVTSREQFFALQTMFESLWGIPVVGSLEEAPQLRAAVASIAAGDKPSAELCRALGEAFCRSTDVDRLIAMADTDFSFKPADCASAHRDSATLRVAIAYDEAFHCYFPATLDLLEAKGATICDFSPLRDERLPADTDIVYLGCGHPESFAQALVENHCLIAALREHVCNGQRVYAECGGLAYMCEHIELPDGSRLPMAGVLPAIARLDARLAAPKPLEVELSRDNWLGASGTRLRGYLNSRWTLEPTAALTCYARCAAGGCLVIGRHQVIGSRLHFDFATHPQAGERFFAPHAAALELSAARSAP